MTHKADDERNAGKTSDLTEIKRQRLIQAEKESAMLERRPVDLDKVAEYREMVTQRVDAEIKKYAEKKPPDSKQEPSSGFIRNCLACNELGDAILFNTLNFDHLIYNAQAGQWMLFGGNCWKFDITDRSKAAMEKVCEACLEELQRIKDDISKIESAGDSPPAHLQKLSREIIKRVRSLRGVRRIRSVLELAHSCEDPLCIEGNEIDNNPWLLGCPNRVFELKTGRNRPGRRKDFIAKVCGTNFEGLEAPCELWEKTLDRIFLGDREVIDFVQRYLGMALVGETIEQKSLFWWGAGANGKTLMAETIRDVLGDYAGNVQPELFLLGNRYANSSGPSPDVMALRGKRIVFASESEEGRRISGARFKQLVGGDTLVGRNLHDKFMVTFKPTHTLVFLTNDKPGAAGHDYAFWRRVYLLEFSARFVDHPTGENEFKADKYLSARLKNEYPGILAWLLNGCLKWLRNGLNPPASVIAATSEYQADEDLIGRWAEDCCYLGKEQETGATEAYNSFVNWYHENVGNLEPSQKAFGNWMLKRFERSKGKPRKYYGLCIIV